MVPRNPNLYVILGSAWREIYEADSERKQDFAEAERTFAVVAEICRECGNESIELPRMAPARAQFILCELRLTV